VLVTGAGSRWISRLSGLSVGNNSVDGQLTITDGGSVYSAGVVAVSGTTYVRTGGYVTNYVAEVSGGLDVGGLSLVGTMDIIFAGAPTELGPYWGLRWAGDHVSTLQGYTNPPSPKLTISDGPELPPYWQGKASIYYDTTNTYVGFFVADIPGPPEGTLLMVR